MALSGVVLVWRGFSAVRLTDDALSDGIVLAASVLIESVPFVFLGIAVTALLQVWLPVRLLERMMPRNGAARRLVLSLCGVLLPVCQCGNVPLARGMLRDGLRASDAMTFLLAAPVVNPVTLVTTYQAFGFRDGILVGRVGGTLLIANLVGWLLSLRHDDLDMLASGFRDECSVPAGAWAPSMRSAAAAEGGASGRLGRVGRLWSRVAETGELFRHETADIFPALVLGAILAGAIQVAVPRSVLLSLGQDPLWAVPALMALAFLVSLCSTVDAFFILGFSSALLPGATLAFLLFGAMVDLKMVLLMSTTFRARHVLLVALMVAVCAGAIGLGVNALVL